MNALLTWWGVSLAIVNYQSLGSAVIDSYTLINIAPVFDAIIVWFIQVLIIGTFSATGEHMFNHTDNSRTYRHAPIQNTSDVDTRSSQSQPVVFNSSPKSTTVTDHRSINRPEPTYHPIGMSGYNVTDNLTSQ